MQIENAKWNVCARVPGEHSNKKTNNKQQQQQQQNNNNTHLT